MLYLFEQPSCGFQIQSQILVKLLKSETIIVVYFMLTKGYQMHHFYYYQQTKLSDEKHEDNGISLNKIDL